MSRSPEYAPSTPALLPAGDAFAKASTAMMESIAGNFIMAGGVMGGENVKTENGLAGDGEERGK